MTRVVEFPQSSVVAGVAEVEITPPVGIYHRMWGAATHDQATGIHRPLRATVLVVAPRNSKDLNRDAAVFIGVDHCLLWRAEMDQLLDRLEKNSPPQRENISVFFSHTHAAGLMGAERAHLPGGELIAGYLEEMAARISSAVREAFANVKPAHIVYGRGACSLAQNRDYWDEQAGAFACGFNPDGPADQTVLIARVTDDATGKPIAIVVNYACHPTTLAWDNTLISPDFVGALRETLREATDAPTLFIQGASGDIGPREGFVGNTEVADRNGRQLAYAALASLEELPQPNTRFEYAGSVTSGATIATWKVAPISSERKAAAEEFQCVYSLLDLPLRDDLPKKETLLADRERWSEVEQTALEAKDAAAARDARAHVERATRGLLRVEHLPDGPTYPYPLRLWRIGDAIWIALDGEHYNILQRELRERFPNTPLVIGTIANGSNVWYLPDRASYGKGLYQEAVSILAAGSLETLIESLASEIEKLLPKTTA